MALHKCFFYVNPNDVKALSNRPWVDVQVPTTALNQIGLLGSMANKSQITSIIHGVNNFIGLPYFWNVEQFLRVGEHICIDSYDVAVKELNKGNAIPLKLGSHWYDLYLDKNGAFHGFECIGKWDETYMKTIWSAS
jgi:hypothetical protein